MSNATAKIRKKKNALWLISKEKIEEAAKNCNSLNSILLYLKMDNKSSSYKTLKKRLQFDNIDISHIKLGLGSNKGKNFVSREKIPLNLILKQDSDYSRTNLKQRLFKEGLLINQCYICGQLPEWNGKPLTLQIDHINGVSNDNRIENLRILCPHCHSQTDNFAGKNTKRQVPESRIVKNGDTNLFVEITGPKLPTPAELDPNWRNQPRPSTRKIERPSKEELKKLLWEKPTTQLALYFGVSDKAIEKWAQNYGLNKPPRGYWQKKVA